MLPIADVFGIFSALGQILKAVEDLPGLILDGGAAVINGVFDALGAALNGLIAGMQALGLTMPTLPSLPTGEWIGWLNWFYPIGAAADIISGAISVYVVWLGIRYLFRLSRFGDDGA